MTTEKITEVVKKKAAIYALIAPEDIKLDSDFINDLGFDSLDQLDMLMEMESEFGIEISDKDAEKVQTVADAVALIHRIAPPNAALCGPREAASQGNGD